MSALGVRGVEAVRGKYLGYPTLTTQTLFIAYTLDGRRVICSSPSHAEVRAAVRAYRGSKR